MRTGIASLFFSLVCFSATSQNLIPNSSFEELNCRPYWRMDYFKCLDHWWAIENTPDVFHIDAIPSTDLQSAHVPQNGMGNQYPRTGNGYAGLFNYTTDDWRESIFVWFTEPMKIGQEYSVGMYTSLADYSDYASNCQGFLFVETYQTLPFPEPHIYNTKVITDTQSWTLLCDSFVADKPYKGVLIRNFFPMDDPRFELLKVGLSNYFSFYYYDDIFVSPTTNQIDIEYKYLDNCFPVLIEFDVVNLSSSDYWEWDFGNGVKNFSEKPTFTFNNPGVYPVTLITRENGRTYEIKREINVSGYFMPNVSFDVGNEREINSSVYFKNTSSNSNSYFWDFGDGTFSNDANPSHIYSDPKDYNVKLIAFNDKGCIDSIIKTIYIRCDTKVKANLFTPNNDEKNDSFDFSVLKECGGVEIEIYNRWGSLIYFSNDPEAGWAGKDLPDGIYYYFIKYREGEEKGMIEIRR